MRRKNSELEELLKAANDECFHLKNALAEALDLLRSLHMRRGLSKAEKERLSEIRSIFHGMM